MTPRIGSLCTGYGGLDMAAQEVFGGEVAWVSDIDKGACKILTHRYPSAPNLGDIKTTDWTAVEPVDIVCAGYPCQPFSNAGLQKGIEDERHIWPYIATALRVLRPRIVILENVAVHLRRGFDTVLADLASLGFDVEWTTVRASDIGAAHRRERLFVLAWPADARGPGLERERLRGRLAERGRDTTANPAHLGHERGGEARGGWPGPAHRSDVDWGRYAPAIRRWERILGRPAPHPVIVGTKGQPKLNPLFDEWHMGLPAGWVTDVPGLTVNQQIHAIGNGVVPQQAAHALRLLTARNMIEVAA